MSGREGTPGPRFPAKARRRTEFRGWLGHGPIQSASGAFYAWVDESTGAGSFEYPEITGYALTYLAGRRDPDPEELRRGHSAAEWLAGRRPVGSCRPGGMGW